MKQLEAIDGLYLYADDVNKKITWLQDAIILHKQDAESRCNELDRKDAEIAALKLELKSEKNILSKEIKQTAALKKEISRYSDRDGNAHIELIYPDDNPFNKIDLRICDFGVADNIYVCESDEVMALKEKVKALEATIYSQGRDHTSSCGLGSLCPWCRIAELEAANAKYRSALEHIEEYWNGDYNEKAMSDACDAVVEIAREALRED